MANKEYHEVLLWPPNPYGFQGKKKTVDKYWTTQRPPFVSTQAFTYLKSETTSFSTSLPDYDPAGNIVGGSYPLFADYQTADVAVTQNKAYAKMVNSLGDQSQWANNLIEARDSIGMIVGRAGQLLSFARKLRKGDFSGAAKSLGQPKPSKKKLDRLDKAKSIGDQWLEYHFGWVPAIQDIGNSVKTLNKTDFGSRKIRVTSTSRREWNNRNENLSGIHPQIRLKHSSATCSVRSQFTSRVTNPNAFLANQMGFVNPLSVAWEAVPYSFVVDWFSNVGQVLSAMTDFVGVDVTNPCTTVCHVVDATDNFVGYYASRDSGVLTYPIYSSTQSTKYVFLSRNGSLLGPTLTVKPFKGFSIQRGATAISLLLQHL